MKPLIFPFATPMGFCFYETQRNEIVAVNEKLYKYITALLNEDTAAHINTDKATKIQFEELISFGYLAPSHIQKLEHSATGLLDNMLDRKLDRVMLQLTQNCNLRCEYCVYSEKSNPNTRNHSCNTMSFETARRAVDFYFAHSIDTNQPAISFYGGEPLLEFGLIKKVVDYAKHIFGGRDLIFAMTTNATLLNDEVIDFVSENHFTLSLSMDGPQSVHDKNRKFPSGRGTFDIARRNIEKLRVKNPTIPISLSMVIDSNSDYNEIVSLFDIPIFSNVLTTAVNPS